MDCLVLRCIGPGWVHCPGSMPWVGEKSITIVFVFITNGLRADCLTDGDDCVNIAIINHRLPPSSPPGEGRGGE